MKMVKILAGGAVVLGLAAVALFVKNKVSAVNVVEVIIEEPAVSPEQ